MIVQQASCNSNPIDNKQPTKAKLLTKHKEYTHLRIILIRMIWKNEPKPKKPGICTTTE